MAETRYTNAGNDGWLRVKQEPSKSEIALPEHLRVEYESTADGRDYFIAREGVESGKRFSVKINNLKTSKPAYSGAATLGFSLSREILTYPGGQIHAITHQQNPIRPGTHPVQIPDFPHKKGEYYLSKSNYAKNWFYMGVGNAVPNKDDRYLHTGLGSAGCVTVDPDEWTRLYNYLILCRSGDGKTVGTIIVTR